jgi:hypothetical protein
VTTEEWRAIDDNYDVSNFGRVRRSTPGNRTFAGRILTGTIGKIGYVVVNPVSCGRNVQFYVHDLVARAFLGPKPPGNDVNHIDGNKTHNVVTNLEYVTHAENMAHAGRTGLSPRGVNHHGAKLTDDDVRALRADRANGRPFSALAQKYGLSIATAFNIATGRSWRHVT